MACKATDPRNRAYRKGFRWLQASGTTIGSYTNGKQTFAALRPVYPGGSNVFELQPSRAGRKPIRTSFISFGFCLCLTMIFGCGQETSTKQLIPSPEIDRKATELVQPKTSDEEVVAPTASIRKLRLIVSVAGFETNEGNCRIAVYLNQPHFNDPEYAIAKESVSIVDLEADWQTDLEIPESPETDAKTPNRLSVSAFHDANTNTRLDKNSFGIPTERYGFSKNPKRGFGPPKFIETTLELDLSDSSIDSRVVVEVPIQIK